MKNNSNNIDLTRLIKESGTPCASIYMPTNPAGGMTRKDALTLKNLSGRCRDYLKDKSIQTDTIQSLLEPVEKLIDDHYFWRYQDKGLAVFSSPDYFDYFQLPIEVEELVYVNDFYYLKPLLPLFNGESNFYLLSLSQKNVSLYQGNRYNIETVEVAGMPASLQEITRYDMDQKQLQMHTPRPQKTGTDSPVYHGHGTAGDDIQQKKKLRQFVKDVNKSLQKELKQEKDKLIVAAVDYLQAMFREVNTYPYLHSEGIEGNPEQWSLKELHGKAWQIMQKVVDNSLARELENYQEGEGSDKTSRDIEKIIPAAYRGRVRTLFVARDEYQWGNFSPDSGEVKIQGDFSPHSKDLLDEAAVFTIMGRGQVFAIPGENMPHASHIAAIYRY